MYTEVTAWRAFRDSATEIADNSAPFVYQKSNPTSCILLPNEIVTMLVVVLDQLSQFFEVLQCYLVFLGTQIGPCHENASLTWSGNRLHLTSRYSRTWSVNVSLATNPSAFFWHWYQMSRHLLEMRIRERKCLRLPEKILMNLCRPRHLLHTSRTRPIPVRFTVVWPHGQTRMLPSG